MALGDSHGDEALSEMRRSRELDPLSLAISSAIRRPFDTGTGSTARRHRRGSVFTISRRTKAKTEFLQSAVGPGGEVGRPVESWNATLAQLVWKSARTSFEMENLSDDGEAFQIEY